MKIYSNVFDPRKPIQRQFYVAPNSVYAFGLKIEDEDEYTLQVFQDDVQLTPMQTVVDGFTLFQKTSGKYPGQHLYDVVYTKGAIVQHFRLLENVTDSTVFDIDQAGGVMDLPIASESILGGIKVGKNLTIDADGTLNAADQKITYEAGNGINITNQTISIDQTVALKNEIPTKVSELDNDSNYVKPNDQGTIVVNGVNAQNVTVSTKLTVNAPAEIGYANLVEAGSSKRYDAWLVESDDSKVKVALASAGKVKTVNGIEPDNNGNIQIEVGEGSTYKIIDGQWTFNQADGIYEYNVENNTVVRLVVDQNIINYKVTLPAQPNDNTVRDCILRLEVTAQTPNVIFASDGAEFESADENWAVLDLGVNLISFTETRRV